MVLHQMHSLVVEEELGTHLVLEVKAVLLEAMVLPEKGEPGPLEVLDRLLEAVEALQQLVLLVKVMVD